MVHILEYVEMLKVIDGMVADSAKPEVNTIDLTLLFSSKTEQPAKAQFKRLLATATGMEAIPLLQAQQKPTQEQNSKPAQTAQRARTDATQAAQPIPAFAAQPQQTQPVQPSGQAAKASALSTAKAELDSLARRLGSVRGAAHVRKPGITQNEGEIVLSKLSTADQVAELERIIEGLNGHAFSSEQLAIIRKEASGLKKILQKGAPEKEPGDQEHSLMFGIIRDKRLDEVLAMLSEGGS